MMKLFYFRRKLKLHDELDLYLRDIVKAKQKPTLIRLSDKASIKYVLEHGFHRVSDGPKLHLGPRCMVELKYNDSTIKWFKIETA